MLKRRYSLVLASGAVAAGVRTRVASAGGGDSTSGSTTPSTTTPTTTAKQSTPAPGAPNTATS